MSYIPDSVYQEIENYKKEGKLDEALKLVNNILIKDPTNSDALLQVADIEYLKGEITNAEKPIDFMLTKAGETDPISYYVKGVLEMEKTDWASAKKYLRKALEIVEYENPEMLRCYALCEYWSGNREKGFDFLDKAHTINGKDAEVIYNLVELNLLEHRYKQAQKYLDYYYAQRDSLDTFGKDISFYDQKMKLFKDYLESI